MASERKRYSEREVTPDEARILIESGAIKGDDPIPRGKNGLKPARSEAELVRVKQGKWLIVLSSINVTIGLLILAHEVGIL